MPALPPLATAADLTDYGYDAVPDPVLARASSRVRRYVRQKITADSSTVTLSGPGPWRLPERPVQEVTSCQDADGNEVEFVLVGSTLYVEDDCPPFTVTYSHGYAMGELSDDLVELVCAVASRLASTPNAVTAGVRTEQAGGETVTWGAEAARGTSGLTSAEEKELDRLFPSTRRLPRTARLL